MSERHYVADAAMLDPGERVIVDVREREIAVFNLDGTYHALSNYCVHQGGPACGGRLSGQLTEDENGELVYTDEDEYVCCPWHGWEFEISSGENLAQPDRFRLPTYETHVQDGEIYVEI